MRFPLFATPPSRRTTVAPHLASTQLAAHVPSACNLHLYYFPETFSKPQIISKSNLLDGNVQNDKRLHKHKWVYIILSTTDLLWLLGDSRYAVQEALKPCKPFLRWAGGKNWFVKYLPEILGDLTYNDYHEPFVGGGSVFFALSPNRAFLSDTNEELIITYAALRDHPEEVIAQIRKWDVNEKQYYEVRSLESDSAVIRSARFIYLNRTSFNGIWRVNKDGKYNVPYGHKDGYKFDFERLRNAAFSLRNADLACRDYADSMALVKNGDLVFIDPPYTVSHNNNGFIEYNKKLFDLDDQYALKSSIDIIRKRGAYFILTNAAHDTVREIFDGIGSVIELHRHCGLGGRNAKRQSIGEYIFTNIPVANLEDKNE